MELMYASTRDANEKVTASQAILKGLANDGGLYVPTEIPSLDVSMEELSKMTYQETAISPSFSPSDRYGTKRTRSFSFVKNFSATDPDRILISCPVYGSVS